MKKLVGVIGENTNDVKTVVGLLKQRFDTIINFFELLKNINGSLLDEGKGNKAANLAAAECKIQKPDFVLYIRDLDALSKPS